MTEITFHFNVPDRTAYACRLLRKAVRGGAGCVVTAAPDVLTGLDCALWSFDATAFVAHAWVERSDDVPPSLRTSMVWLATEPEYAPAHDALVNLGNGMPAGFESFERLIELVSSDAADRDAARLRWKDYAARGYEIRTHDVAS